MVKQIITLIKFHILKRLGLSVGTIEGELFIDTIIANCNHEESFKRITDYIIKYSNSYRVNI